MFQLQHGAIAIDIANYFYSFQLFQFDANGCSMWLFVRVQPRPRIWDEVRECKKNWFTRLLRWFCMYCIVLSCLVLYYIILNCIILYFIILYYITFHFILLYCFILYIMIYHKCKINPLLCFSVAWTPGSKSMGGIHREQCFKVSNLWIQLWMRKLCLRR